ncbi:LPXTG cell wall anchor domain-containing protein [Dactylosporangium sp. NPDC000244]
MQTSAMALAGLLMIGLGLLLLRRRRQS